MAKVRIVWRAGVFRELRTLPAVLAELNSHATRIAATAGPGFEAAPAAVTGGRGRGRAAVLARTFPARVRQARNHVIEKSL